MAFTIAWALVASYRTFQFVFGEHGRGDGTHFWGSQAGYIPASLLSGMLFTQLGEALKHEVPSRQKRSAGWRWPIPRERWRGRSSQPFSCFRRSAWNARSSCLAILYCTIGLLALPDAFRRKRKVDLVGAAAPPSVLMLVFFPFGLMSRAYFARRRGRTRARWLGDRRDA